MCNFTWSTGSRFKLLILSVLLAGSFAAWGQKFPDGPERTPINFSGSGNAHKINAPGGSIAVNENPLYNTYTPAQLVENILVSGCLKTSNVSFTGEFNTNDPNRRQLGYFNKASSSFPLAEGLIISSGFVSEAEGPNNSQGSGLNLNGAGDADLNQVSGYTTHDAAVLQFDFVPAGDKVEFQYIFASEEYPEWCCTQYNDVFGFFIDGPGITGPFSNNSINIGILPNTSPPVPITINNIHKYVASNHFGNPCQAQNPELYTDNPNGSLIMQYDGSTVILTATYNVTACQSYHIKIKIADVSDGIYSSAVFLKARSFSSEPITITNNNPSYGSGDFENIFEGCSPMHLIISRPSTETENSYPVQLQYSGTVINGVDVKTLSGDPLPAVITIPAGDTSFVLDYYAVSDGFPDNGEVLMIGSLQGCPCDTGSAFVFKNIRIWENLSILSVEADNILCGSQANGTISVNAGGGSGNYYYSLDGTNWQASGLFTGLSQGTYTVYVKDTGNCNAPVSQPNITIGPPMPIQANAGPDVTICSGTSTHLFGSGGVNYSWSPGVGLSSTSIPDPVASPATTTSYILTVTSANNFCTSKDTVIVTVIPSPSAAITPASSEICEGSDITLSASGGGTYLWNPGGDVTPAITVSPVTNTSYTVIVTASNGCTSFVSSDVFVDPAPEQFTVTGGGMICPGSAAPVGLSASDTGVYYQLMIEGMNLGTPVPGTGSSINFGELQGAGVYTVIAKEIIKNCTAQMTGNAVIFMDTVSPVIYCTENIAVNVSPGLCNAIVATPDPVQSDNCAVTVLTWSMTGATTGNSPPEGINVVGSHVFNTGTTIITYTVKDISNLSASCSFQIIVTDNEPPAIICPADIIQLVDTNTCYATVTVPLPLINDNCPGAVAQNDYTGTGDASGSYPSGSTIVTWIAVDNSGNADTCQQTIRIISYPRASDDLAETQEDTPVSIPVLANDQDCDNNIVAGSLSVISGPLHGMVSIDPVTWNILYHPDLNFNGSDSFIYQVCDSDNLCDHASVLLTVSPVNDPPVTVNENVSLCENTSVSGNILANGDSDPVENTPVNITMPAIVEPSHGILTLQPDGDFLYVPSGEYFGSDMAVVSVCDNGLPLPPQCMNDTIFFDVMEAVMAEAGSDQELCNAETTILTGSSPLPGTGYWTEISGPNVVIISPPDSSTATVTGMIPGIYQFLYTVTTGTCSTMDSMTVVNDNLPTPSNAGPDQDLCLDGNSTTATSMSANTPQYGTGLWAQVSGPGTADIEDIYDPATLISNLEEGSYQFKWTITNGICPSSEDLVLVTPWPLSTAYAGEDDIICEGSDYTLANSSAEGYLSLSWQTTGDGIFIQPDQLHPVYVPGPADISAGQVILILNSLGHAPCSAATDEMQLTITSAPYADAGPGGTICQDATFTVSQASASGYSELTWTTNGSGILKNPQELYPIYIPAAGESGTIYLFLEVSGISPCTQQVFDSLALNIVPQPVADAGTDISLCEAEPYTVNDATADNYTGIYWTSTGSGVILDNGTLNPTYIPATGETGNITLTLTLSANDPCTGVSDTKLLVYHSLPVANAGSDQTISPGTAAILSGIASGGSGLFSYSWEPAPFVLNPGSDTTTTVLLNENMTFYLTVTDMVTGCSQSDSVVIHVGQVILAPVAIDDYDTTIMNIPIIIDYLKNDINPYGNALNTLFCGGPSHGTMAFQYDSILVYSPDEGFEGTDNILYTLHNPLNGLFSDTATISILVGPEIPIVIHNVITPNKDGINDTWTISGIEKYPQNDVTIFNRWGDEIRSFTGYDNVQAVWDGTNRHNEPASDGTYFYILHIDHVGSFNGWIYVCGNTY